jgi:glycosyltransferase involved in cell wall biosynthesis
VISAPAPRISVVVPAFNESKLIERCLHSIDTAFEAAGVPAEAREIIVVDNGSTDDTGARAKGTGVRVVHEPVRQISRARNAGAKFARGEWLVFLDADSWPARGLVEDMLLAMADPKTVGGGATLRMEPLPQTLRVLMWAWNLCSRCMRWAAGSFVFCRRDAFEAVNGFDTTLFAGEEINLSRKLKTYANWRSMRFVILSGNPLCTSARKGELYSPGEIVGALGRMILHPRRFFRDPALCSVWYDGRR